MFRSIVLTAALLVSAMLLSGAGCGSTVAEPTAVTESKSVITVAQPTNTARRPPTDTVPPPEPTETPVPPSPTAEVNVFEIGEPVARRQEYGNSIEVIGVIKYTGSIVRREPEIIVTLTDASDKVLASGNAIYTPDYIVPNSNIPYFALLDGPVEEWAKIEIDIQSEALTGFYEELVYKDVAVDQPSLVPPSNEYENMKIVGRVKNTGSEIAQFVEIVGVLYDEAGKPLDVNSTYARKDELSPGEDSPFELTFRVKGGTSFELFTSGRKK
jgi:hypothetical protein